MPEFILDTFGEVVTPAGRVEFRDLDAFTQGYIEALFFTESDPEHEAADFRKADEVDALSIRESKDSFADVREDWEGSIPNDVGFDALAPDALAVILADCERFQASPAWRAVVAADAAGGRDFWYTRQGHGCGFWDGDWPEPHGEALTEAAKAFGEVYPYFDGEAVRF